MKSISSKYEMLDIPEPTERLEVLKHLERIGRVCYKSEDKITDESCIKFVQGIRDRKHWAMLEHYIFVFEVPIEIFQDIFSVERLDAENYNMIDKLAFIRGSYYYNIDDSGSSHPVGVVSASATALNYLWECIDYPDSYPGIIHLCHFMMARFPELMKDPYPMENKSYQYDERIRFIDREELEHMPRDIRMLHDSMSIKFTVDRGVTHELVRHRPCSWAQESTRYCNYSGGKFGEEITVIEPNFFKQTMEGYDTINKRIWRRACKFAETEYLNLIKFGAKPQEARSILPNSLKAEIVMTARMIEMRHFFKMRADKAAHPQMQEVARPLLQECIDNDPMIFKDLSWLLNE